MEVESEQDLFESFAVFLCFAEANLQFCLLPLFCRDWRLLRGHAASERDYSPRSPLNIVSKIHTKYIVRVLWQHANARQTKCGVFMSSDEKSVTPECRRCNLEWNICPFRFCQEKEHRKQYHTWMHCIFCWKLIAETQRWSWTHTLQLWSSTDQITLALSSSAPHGRLCANLWRAALNQAVTWIWENKRNVIRNRVIDFYYQVRQISKSWNRLTMVNPVLTESSDMSTISGYGLSMCSWNHAWYSETQNQW